MTRDRRKVLSAAPVAFCLTGLGQSSDRRVEVFIAGRSDGLWLPRSAVFFKPGHVLIPDWLCRKLKLKEAKCLN